MTRHRTDAPNFVVWERVLLISTSVAGRSARRKVRDHVNCWARSLATAAAATTVTSPSSSSPAAISTATSHFLSSQTLRANTCIPTFHVIVCLALHQSVSTALECFLSPLRHFSECPTRSVSCSSVVSCKITLSCSWRALADKVLVTFYLGNVQR